MWRNLLSSLRDFGINRGNVSGDCRHRHRAIVPAGTKSHLSNRCQYAMKLLPKILHGVARWGFAAWLFLEPRALPWAFTLWAFSPDLCQATRHREKSKLKSTKLATAQKSPKNIFTRLLFVAHPGLSRYSYPKLLTLGSAAEAGCGSAA